MAAKYPNATGDDGFSSKKQGLPNSNIPPDLLFKMCKKIAQLTKVVYTLNMRNDDLELQCKMTRLSDEAKVTELNKQLVHYKAELDKRADVYDKLHSLQDGFKEKDALMRSLMNELEATKKRHEEAEKLIFAQHEVEMVELRNALKKQEEDLKMWKDQQMSASVEKLRADFQARLQEYQQDLIELKEKHRSTADEQKASFEARLQKVNKLLGEQEESHRFAMESLKSQHREEMAAAALDVQSESMKQLESDNEKLKTENLRLESLLVRQKEEYENKLLDAVEAKEQVRQSWVEEMNAERFDAQEVTSLGAIDEASNGLPYAAIMDQLICGLCHEQYDYDNEKRRPKFLQCFHTFCAECLIKAINANQVACPTCKKFTTVSKKGISSLQDNLYLRPILESSLIYQSDEEDSDYNDDDDDDDTIKETEGDASDDGKYDTEPKAQIWCDTCLKVATTNCITNHEICNYRQGMNKLEMQLQTTVEQAGQLLQHEISDREPILKYLECSQVAITELLKHLNDLCTDTATQLQIAKSEVDELASLHPIKCDGNLEESMVASLQNAQGKVQSSLKRIQSVARVKAIWDAVNAGTILFHPKNNSSDLEDMSDLMFNVNITDGNLIEKVVGFACFDITCRKLQGKPFGPAVIAGAQDSSWTVVEKGRSSKKSISEYSDVHSVDGDAIKPYSSVVRDAKSQSLSNLPGAVAKELIHNHAPVTRSPRCYFDLTADGVPLGRVVFELRPDIAPRMCKNFIDLCKGTLGFGYKGCKIFKAHTNDHIVGGDFVNNDGTGGYSAFNKGLFLADNSPLKDQEGALRMKGMGTSPTGEGQVGSQFHIWVGKREFRDFKRTLVIGMVVQGLDICKRISNFRIVKNVNNQLVIEKKVVIVRCGQL